MRITKYEKDNKLEEFHYDKDNRSYILSVKNNVPERLQSVRYRGENMTVSDVPEGVIDLVDELLELRFIHG